MIELPTMLGRSVRAYLTEYYKSHNIPEPDDVRNLYDKNAKFLESELDLVKSIRVDEQALPYMDYFHNLSSISFYGNGVSSQIDQIIQSHPNLTNLEIFNATNLGSLNISSLSNLYSLNITSSDIGRIIGIENLSELNNVTFVDNPVFSQESELAQIVANNFQNMSRCNFDILLYPEIIKNLEQLNKSDLSTQDLSKLSFSEIVGVRNEQPLDYSFSEAKEIYDTVNQVVSNYIKPSDTPEQKYAIIHQWMQENVKYTKSSDKVNGQNGSYNAIVKKGSVCQGYSKAMQVLLKTVGIKSFDIACKAASEQAYDAQSLKVSGDVEKKVEGNHSILKVNLNFPYSVYYSDVTWDAGRYQNGKDSQYFLLSKEDISKDHELIGEDMVITPPSKTKEERETLLTFASERIKSINKQREEHQFIDKVDDINELRSKLQASTERYRQISSEIEELMKRNAVTPISNYEEQLQNLIEQRDKENVSLEKYRYAEAKASELAHKGMLNNITRATGVIISPVKSYEVDAKTGVPIEIPKDKVELAHELGEMKNRLDEAMQNGIIDMQTCIKYKRFVENEYHSMQKDAPYHQKEQQLQYSPQTQESNVGKTVEEDYKGKKQAYEEVSASKELMDQVQPKTKEEIDADLDLQNYDSLIEEDEPKKQFESDDNEDQLNFEKEDIEFWTNILKNEEARRMVEGIPQHPEQLEHSHGRIM